MTYRRLLGMAVLLVVSSGAVAAQGIDRFELGARANVVGGDGEPANDILGGGVYARHRLGGGWLLGFAVDHSPGFDVERPYEFLGLVGDPAAGEIDADGTMTSLVAWIEREYGRPGGRLEWFLGLGGGGAALDADPISGPLAGGGVYDITQDVGTEWIAAGLAGLRVRFGGAWAFETGLRLEQHFTDWTVTDRVSGRTVSLDDYQVRGVHLGLGHRF